MIVSWVFIWRLLWRVLMLRRFVRLPPLLKILLWLSLLLFLSRRIMILSRLVRLTMRRVLLIRVLCRRLLGRFPAYAQFRLDVTVRIDSGFSAVYSSLRLRPGCLPALPC